MYHSFSTKPASKSFYGKLPSLTYESSHTKRIPISDHISCNLRGPVRSPLRKSERNLWRTVVFPSPPSRKTLGGRRDLSGSVVSSVRRQRVSMGTRLIFVDGPQQRTLASVASCCTAHSEITNKPRMITPRYFFSAVVRNSLPFRVSCCR